MRAGSNDVVLLEMEHAPMGDAAIRFVNQPDFSGPEHAS